MEAPSPRELSDLALDLVVEVGKLDALLESLVALDAVVVDRLRVDAAALRLQSFYTGIERCLLQIIRVLNGSTLDGWDWHRRLLDRMEHATQARPAVFCAVSINSLQELLRFRHLVRHLYAYEWQPEPVERLRALAIALWPDVRGELKSSQCWLTPEPVV
ncbi:MAG: hypothetical protein ACK550_07080 [Synechococcaceae cyanobacterium]